MKKILMLVVLAIAAITANAQVEAGFRQGVRVNLGASNIAGEGDKMTFGYGLGWVAEYNFSPKFYVQSGLGLENIAHKEDGISGTINGYYLQLPIHAGYRFELGETNSLFVQAGPTLGVGLFGSDIEYTGGKIGYFDFAKRFDLGLGGRIGVEFSKFQVSVGANYGVLEAAKHGDGYHTLTVNAGVAYIF
ncbi:MAG: porin family protein [Clostridium sp.]|nr:porin family protein [Clostridium sp.]